ncbi:FAD-dependent oxidoreductase [Balneolaceae bacterium YR4-1]|uniref:FAD-dependent oxidoreductase n=1 Tax=Halalkalibaculum roseum TaxID=2709311 RepID=A0A6M1T3V0_9BACT|nr:FAD-dependent oxidoreductase [Halalkalibaculum roseum]NGP77417.1 FAD-dependent oxidoreductase [Halalkalibaculum roseum]
MKNKQSYDVIIIGSGFSGSLTALCLLQSGLSVCVLEKDRHPRFAVGESSTPIADMILRSISEEYDLPWLKHFSRYGSWQRHYPDITCGLKRGFSYYKHNPHEQFSTDKFHANQLLVAASVNVEQSDTNWMRSEFDAFLAEKLLEYDIPYFENTEVVSVEQDNSGQWVIDAFENNNDLSIRADFMVDATGSPRFIGKFLGIDSLNDGFETKSRAVFSHFEDVKPWKNYLEENGISTNDYPYNPDYSALHHLLEEGWLWMLRFNNGVTSTGLLLDLQNEDQNSSESPNETWNRIINRYPSLEDLFEHAVTATDPGKMLQTGRLQRRLKRMTGKNWAALPHTAGFVDPMHSTGIAHTLSGLEKLVQIIVESGPNKESLRDDLSAYEQQLIQELKLVDLLVGGSYRSMDHFELFNVYTMLYFIAAISYEQSRLRGEIPSHFLSAGREDIFFFVAQSYNELKHITKDKISVNQVKDFRDRVKNRIEPYNIAGLLDPDANNMYRHTAVEF